MPDIVVFHPKLLPQLHHYDEVKIDAGVLKTDTDLYAHALAHMLSGARFPVSLVAQVDALGEAIAVRDQEAGGALQLDRRLGQRLEQLREVAATLDERAAASQIGPVDQVAFLRPLHRVMYVPLNDYHPDPGITLGPLPGLAPGRIMVDAPEGSDRRGFALPVLLRERNRLAEAMDEALSIGRARTTLSMIAEEPTVDSRASGIAWGT